MGGADQGRAGDGPAGLDWPRGHDESTWWPLVVAAGAVGLYSGVGLLVLARLDEPLVGRTLALLVLAGGSTAFVGGLAGWTYQGFVSRYHDRSWGAVADRFRWGTLLFLCAEVATFGAGFGYYAYVRAGPWPPGPLPDLLSSLVAANTAILVSSSVVLHVADGALRAGRRRRFVRLLGLTVLLGGAFLAGQAYEYYEFVVHEGFTPATGVFASTFFGLTGLHGLHVALGVTLLSIVLLRARAGQYAVDRHASVTTAVWYWHFVDAVWLVLVASLYVGAAVTV